MVCLDPAQQMARGRDQPTTTRQLQGIFRGEFLMSWIRLKKEFPLGEGSRLGFQICLWENFTFSIRSDVSKDAEQLSFLHQADYWLSGTWVGLPGTGMQWIPIDPTCGGDQFENARKWFGFALGMPWLIGVPTSFHLQFWLRNHPSQSGYWSSTFCILLPLLLDGQSNGGCYLFIAQPI